MGDGEDVAKHTGRGVSRHPEGYPHSPGGEPAADEPAGRTVPAGPFS